jgi:tight adherence protein C
MTAASRYLAEVVPAATAVAAGLLVLLVARVRLPAATGRTAGDALPWWLRVLLPLARPLGAGMLPLVGRTRWQRLGQQLARCDLDQQLDAGEWLGLRMLLSLLPAGLAVLGQHVLQLDALALSGAIALGGGWLLGGRWLAQRRQQRENQILKELPGYLDVLTLCVEAGASLMAALRIAVDRAPDTALRGVCERILREVRAGRTRVAALGHVASVYELPALTTLATALIQSEGAGISLGSVLRAQSEQRAAERHARAEKLALQAPVKMLGPLILCIFPCTFIVIAVPVVARIMGEGGG